MRSSLPRRASVRRFSPSLCINVFLSSTRINLALADDADAVGHFLGFLDVMGGQDNGDAGLAQRAHHRPHVAAQLDVDAGGRLVEEEDARLMRQRLGDHQAPLHAAGQGHDPAVLLVPQRKIAQQLFDKGRIGGLAEQAATEADAVEDAGEGVRRQLLRHEADLLARGAIVAEDVMAVGEDDAACRVDDAADDADQRRLARAIWAEQGEDLAPADIEVDRLQRLEAGGVDFGQVGDGNDRSHEAPRLKTWAV